LDSFYRFLETERGLRPAILLELEAETKWDAVDASWKQRRPNWLKELKMIAGEK
jgi:hypothetical protein